MLDTEANCATWQLIIVRVVLFGLAVVSTWENVNDLRKQLRVKPAQVVVNAILWTWFVHSMGGFGVVPE